TSEQMIDGLLQLKVIVTTEFEHLGLFDVIIIVLGSVLIIFVMQVTLQVTLARDSEQIALGSIIYIDIRSHSGHLDRTPIRRIVQGCGEFNARLIIKRQNTLN